MLLLSTYLQVRPIIIGPWRWVIVQTMVMIGASPLGSGGGGGGGDSSVNVKTCLNIKTTLICVGLDSPIT